MAVIPVPKYLPQFTGKTEAGEQTILVSDIIFLVTAAFTFCVVSLQQYGRKMANPNPSKTFQEFENKAISNYVQGLS